MCNLISKDVYENKANIIYCTKIWDRVWNVILCCTYNSINQAGHWVSLLLYYIGIYIL